MKLRETTLAIGVGILAGAQLAHAGGLFLPGAGAVSTARAGAAVASADDGEALAINPAGLAKAKGTTITISAAIISYAMQFQRRGTYDAISEEDVTYEGQKYPVSKNDAKPPLGFGSFQPVPVIAVVSDLGGAVPGLHVAAGLYAPNAYPFRDMCTQQSSGCDKYTFDPVAQANGTDNNIAPPPTRYDIMKQEAAVLLPSVAVAYHLPIPVDIDVGGRYSLGFATLKSTTAIWGLPANYDEFVKKDGVFTVDAKANFISTFGLGATYRPTPNLEFGVNYSYEIDIHAKGTAHAVNGADVSVSPGGPPLAVTPADDAAARCAKGGTADALKACVDLSLPMTAQIGGRYKFVDDSGKLKADIELDLNWEHWGVHCDGTDSSCISPSEYRVVVDAQAGGISLRDSYILHGLKDVYGARLGGSYHLPVAGNDLTIRGGLAYDSAAAKDGWLRADLDGAARTTIAAGAGYKMKRWEVNAGLGVILEGSPSNGGTCNPITQPGCNNDGMEQPVKNHVGPDPISPILDASQQAQAPVNQGDYKSHYLMFMLGASTWF